MKKHIVIVGGGFAGLNLISQLSNHPDFQITLIDKNNYNFFPPLLYQVATGFLETSNISYPFRKLLRKHKNANFRMAEVLEVRTEDKTIVLDNGVLSYDYLVFSTGTETNYFGMENVRKYAIPMKTINDAIDMRNILLQRMEMASITTDAVLKKTLLTVVVAGGGPTGVEVAGMFAELWKNALKKDYPELAGSGGAIYLVDGGNKVLAPMSAKSQEDAYRNLTEMGVKVEFNKQVKDFDGNQVVFGDGTFIETQSVIWAAGVTAKTFSGLPNEIYGRGKRMLVNEFNQVLGFDHIYALGDTSLMSGDPGYESGHPQLAQVAIQQGKNLGKNLRKSVAGQAMAGFRYHDKGSMAVIGRNKAVADLTEKLHFKGYIAWLMWIFVHVMSLINYRNRLTTLYNWTTTYFTMDQSLRFIFRPDNRYSVHVEKELASKS